MCIHITTLGIHLNPRNCEETFHEAFQYHVISIYLFWHKTCDFPGQPGHDSSTKQPCLFDGESIICLVVSSYLSENYESLGMKWGSQDMEIQKMKNVPNPPTKHSDFRSIISTRNIMKHPWIHGRWQIGESMTTEDDAFGAPFIWTAPPI